VRVHRLCLRCRSASYITCVVADSSTGALCGHNFLRRARLPITCRASAAITTFALLSCISICAPAQTAVRGCYRASRPLGTAASADGVPGPIGERIGEAGPALAKLATFRLLEDGRVDRPGTVMESLWKSGSLWTLNGDTLMVRLSTRTSGWQLLLLPDPRAGESAYVGEGRYLTDVVVRDTSRTAWHPPRVPVRVTREACAPPT
jgi:hypothetical protein